jgi:diguanylate cyclase
VIFEITETDLMISLEEIEHNLKKLSNLGVKWAVDDFGTGYSSLSRLKNLPISILKIDKSFVKDIPIDQDDSMIVQSVIALGKSLNLSVIAEGVETKEQLDFLRDNNCAKAQGFHLSTPLSEIEMTNILKEIANQKTNKHGSV